MKRTWQEAQKRQVAARNGWRCGSCSELLPSTFEVDHVTPLADGGSDCIVTNSCALCCGCHRQKTQDERIARVKRRREDALAAHEKARRELESTVRAEYANSIVQVRRGVSKCELCGETFYNIFPHGECGALRRAVRRRVDAALGETVAPQDNSRAHTFDRFMCVV